MLPVELNIGPGREVVKPGGRGGADGGRVREEEPLRQSRTRKFVTSRKVSGVRFPQPGERHLMKSGGRSEVSRDY